MIGLVVALIPLGASGQVAITKIHAVQGNGSVSPIINTNVTVEGVVVGDFQQSGGFSGFYLQEEDLDQDQDPTTSEGVFVFNSTAVAVGDHIRVAGRVTEFGGQTQLSSATVSALGAGTLPIETVVGLPVAALSDLERFEGMLVTFTQDLFISEFFNYDRFGEIVLTTTRQYQGTHAAEPGAAANAVASANRLARITLDDGSNTQNPTFNRHPNGAAFTLANTFRGGDILQNVTGILGEGFGLYRIQPTEGAGYINANPRPTSPDSIAGDIRVASFNVLNYFTHLDDGVNDICGPTGNLECRGADTPEELQRQQAKLVAGVIALDADIVGIQEIENDIRDDDGNRAHDAILTLVEALNAAEGAGTWAWVGAANHYNDYPVRNEILYKPASVELVGSPVALADSAFDRKLPGLIEPVGRPPLAQTFREIVDGGSRQAFTVVVNHFKSKSSSCASIGDPDLFDGQANCNLTRVAQSHALLDFIAELEEDSSGVLVIGDLNSYAMEDPIAALKEGGLIELVERFEGADAYSFVFDGQLGYLDTALATRSMSNWVKDLTTFHINADEPDILDYDMSFKPPEQDALYEAKPYRVSDHDPVIIGITFGGSGR
ncbi:MAG: ExeM/NucH family extracellular endonuclease [Acidimicrobiia bacterium]